jgi:hypothetical protein
MFATKEQIAEALAFNAQAQSAIVLAESLRALLGMPLGDGYVAEMIDPIMELQASMALGPDGKVGEMTSKALQRLDYLKGDDCGSIWGSEDATPLARRAYYLTLYERFASVPATGGPRLLGIRGAYPFARRTHRMIHARRFDDSFVLITDSDAVIFRGATHAYQTSFATSTGAVASIRPGSYHLELNEGSDPPIFNLTLPNGVGDIPAYRDNDHDGVISETEVASALAANKGKGATANEIQFHPGYDTFKVKGGGATFSSVGCQTAPLAALHLLESAGSSIDYVLANASDLAQSTNPIAPVGTV